MDWHNFDLENKYNPTLIWWIKIKIRHIWDTIYYGIRDRLFTRWHILDIRSAGDDYRLGWLDRDNVMLLACFKILVQFVEQENDFETFGVDRPADPEDDPSWAKAVAEQMAVERELLALYYWWTVERKQEADAAFVSTKSPEKWKSIIALNEKDQQQLEKLIKLRGNLWT